MKLTIMHLTIVGQGGAVGFLVIIMIVNESFIFLNFIKITLHSPYVLRQSHSVPFSH